MTAGTGVPRRRVLPTDLLRADSGAKARSAPPASWPRLPLCWKRDSSLAEGKVGARHSRGCRRRPESRETGWH